MEKAALGHRIREAREGKTLAAKNWRKLPVLGGYILGKLKEASKCPV